MHNKKRLLTAQCYWFCIPFTEAVKVRTVDDATTTTATTIIITIMMMMMMMMMIIIIIIIIIELLRDHAAAHSGLPS